MIIRNGEVVFKHAVEKADIRIQGNRIVEIASYIPADGSV